MTSVMGKNTATTVDGVPKLEAPHEYECGISAYDPSLSRLYVRLLKSSVEPADERYLVFSTTIYFDGPFTWKGADFQLGSDAGIIELLEHINPVPAGQEFIDRTLGLILYKFEGTRYVVRILAAACRTADLGSNFKMRYPEGINL